MTFLKKRAENIKKKINIFTPTQNRILSMDRELLIKHYALVRLRVSSMSSEERRILLNRVNYGIEKGLISVEDLQKEVDKIQDIFNSN